MNRETREILFKAKRLNDGDCLGHKQNIVEYSCGGFTINGDRPLCLFAKDSEVVGNVFDKE